MKPPYSCLEKPGKNGRYNDILNSGEDSKGVTVFKAWGDFKNVDHKLGIGSKNAEGNKKETVSEGEK